MCSWPQWIADVPLGQYASIWKMVLLLGLIALWARALTWIDKDAQAAYLPRQWINLGMLGMLVAAMALIFLPLSFFVVFPLILLLFVGSIAGYLGLRQVKVGLDDLKKSFQQNFLNSKKSAKLSAVQRGTAILFFGSKDALVAPPEPQSPGRPAYDAAQDVLSDALLHHAQRIDVTPTDKAALVRYAVDGQGYDGPSLSREMGALAVTYLKRYAGLDVNDKRKPQVGTARVRIGTVAHELQVRTQGSTAGEFLKIIVDPKTQQRTALEDLGLTTDQLAAVQASITRNRGLVLASAPKGQGLTTLMYAMIRKHDAFLQQIQSIERNPDHEIDGVAQNKLAPRAAPAEERKLVEWVCSQQPDVLLMEQVEDSGSARELVQFVHGTEEGGKRLYVGLREGGVFETMAAWRKLTGPDCPALQDLELVVTGRVIRRLCVACKEAYTPDTAMLRKLNISIETAGTLFQERHSPLLDAKGKPVRCEFCQGLGFQGLLGVYEVLIVDDELRQAVLAGAPALQLKTLFRKQGARSLQEAALAAVQRGDTSVREVVRALRGEATPA